MAEETNKGEIAIYKHRGGPKLSVTFDKDTVWLNQAQIAKLFGTKRQAITKHIKNIFKTGELKQNSVSSILEHTADDGKTYKVLYYNLDAIISVGYRVNSSQATQFRIWATNKLRELLIKGFVINEKRLKQYQAGVLELKQSQKIFRQALESRESAGFEKELLSIISDYLYTWTILNEYDSGKLSVEFKTKRKTSVLDMGKAAEAINRFRDRLFASGQASELFGREIEPGKLSGILKGINQSLKNREIYPSIEEKASHLFYFVIKDHPFTDGNKRIGSLLLIMFLIENHYLYNRKGERKINDAALAALALLVAESKPEQKNAMIKLIANLIGNK